MNNPTHELVFKVLSQMKEEEIFLYDSDAEYYDGVNTTYRYSHEKKCFIVSLIDIIAASFFEEVELSDKEMAERVTQFSLYDLQQQGFRV